MRSIVSQATPRVLFTFRLLAALLCFFTSGEAHARFYQVVSATEDGAADQLCSLREALQAARTQVKVDGCLAGDPGWNEIEITGNAPVNLTKNEPIEIATSVSIYSNLWPGRLIINGASSYFLVRSTGDLDAQNIKFSNFSVNAFYIEQTTASASPPTYLRGHLELTSCEISGNGSVALSQTNSILNKGGVVQIRESLIRNNKAIKGGAVYNQGGRVDIYSSSLTGNTASQYGGAIHNVESGYVTVSNTTISNNTAGDGSSSLGGGAIYSASGVIDIKWSTIVNNQAGYGGGIYNAGPNTWDVVSIRDSIVSLNVELSGGGPTADCKGPIKSTGYNLLTRCPGAAAQPGDIVGNFARLEAVTVPSGSNWFQPLYYYNALNSPAYNAIPWGTGDCKSGSNADDIIGAARPAGGPGSACDMGAKER